MNVYIFKCILFSIVFFGRLRSRILVRLWRVSVSVSLYFIWFSYNFFAKSMKTVSFYTFMISFTGAKNDKKKETRGIEKANYKNANHLDKQKKQKRKIEGRDEKTKIKNRKSSRQNERAISSPPVFCDRK